MSAFGSRPGLKHHILALVALVMACVPAIAVANSEIVVFESGFSSDQWSWDRSAEGDLFPVLEGTRSLSEPGLPVLPVQDLVLLIPAGRQVIDAWVEPLSLRTEKLSEVLAMATAHITDGGEMISTNRMQADNGVFPAAWGEFSGTHTWRGYNLLTVSVYPARTENQEITFLEEYAVQVVYADGDRDRLTLQRERLVAGEKEGNEEILRAVLSNPRAISGYARVNGMVVADDKGPFIPTRTPSLSGSAVQYVIITNEAMKEEFQRLADYKTSIGMPSLVVTREFIAANYRNGADIQETIRMFIQDAYGKWGTEYVMLGGDTDILPARYVNNSFYPAVGSTKIPVDLYFACLDGNWNANGNSEFGEADGPDFIGDDADFAEEVYLGRATVSSPEAAEVFVNKVITYENTPQGSGWPNRFLYACEVLFPAEYEEGMTIVLDGAQFADQMVNDYIIPCSDMEFVRMYETDELYPRDAVLTKDALIDSLNTGHYGIFNQVGHGFYFNMSVGDGNFMTTDADNLTNGDHLFVLFSLNCASAAFDYSCLMERFLQNPNGGSIVSIGSSRAAFPNNSNNYQQGFFEALLCTEDNRAGKLIAISRLPYLGNTIYNYVDRWTFENYTLLGDPTLPIWTGVPEELDVSSSSMSLGPNNVTVVVNGDGSPMENAQVCLSRDGEDLASGFTNVSGAVSLDYLANTAGDVNLRVTGVDLAQHISTVNVLDGTTYLALADLFVGDDTGGGSIGNGNLEIESGETVELFPVMQETAGSGTTGLTGVLSTDEPLVNITTNTVDYYDISGGGQAGPLDPFLVSFDASLVDGTPVTFSLTLTDGSADVYQVEWTTIVKAPEVEVVLLDWEDVTYGNGDGFLGEDERILISLKIKNFGAGQADVVDILLESANANVTIYDSEGTVSTLELMETSDEVSTFSLSLSDISRNSRSTIVLTDNYGRSTGHDFFVQRPLTPLNIDTDTSLGADVIALIWDPVEDEGLFGYNVFRSLNAGGPFEKVNQDVIFGTSYYRDEGLMQLTKYFYQVISMGESLVPSTGSVVVEQATAPGEASGFPVEFDIETSGHLAIGDVDGDGQSEIILGADELYVWHHDGTELMDGDNDSQTLGPLTDLSTTLHPAGIVLAELDGEPGLEMIACDSAGSNLVYIYNKDGEVIPGWPQDTSGGSGAKWVWATPAVGDLDGDGDLEIVLNALNGRTWAWHHDGTEVIDGDNDPATNGVFLIRSGATWEWNLSSPALCDLDGDGGKDIIFGTGSDDLGGPRVTALKADGSHVAGFPYFTSNRVNNSPAVGDLNNDGILEIVFYDTSGNLFAVQQDGTDYPGFPVAYGFGTMSGGLPSVALGDMDGDGQFEIIFAGNVTGDLSKLVIVDTDISGGTSGQSLSGWPRDLPGSSEGSPVIGDIDGDSVPDILYGIGGGSEDAPNNLYAFKANGSAIDGFPITLNGPLMPSPVICDLDNDLDVDIVYGGWDRAVHVWDMPFAYDANLAFWPTFHGNMNRDGVIATHYLVPVEDGSDLPAAAFKVDSPYPNPFNPSTSIRLHVPVVNGSSSLELVVYDLQGRKVRTLHNGPISSGWHTMVWDGRDNTGRNQSSGMYFMRAVSGHHSSIHKMTLVK
jgi:hypothetical protein